MTALLILMNPAFSQAPVTSAGSDRVVYDAAFYAAFSPRTALDMIAQTPGFVLNAPEEDERRGFAGAVGNVLIDGERLSAKSQSLRDVLERVPATDVVRIEILRGAEVAGDASNATVLANVVRTRASGSGTWEAGSELSNQHSAAPYGRFGWSGRNDSVDYSIGANMYHHDHAASSVRELRDGAGNVIANRRGNNPHEEAMFALNGQTSIPAGDGKLVLTGQAQSTHYQERFSQRATAPAGGQLENEIAPYEETTRTGEIGLTWQRPIGDWSMDLVGLATRKKNSSDALYFHFDAADVQDTAFDQRLKRDSGETIARGTFTLPLSRGQFEWGGEVAFNTLDGELSLTEDAGDGPIDVPVPNANLSVEENRAEAFASHAWRLDERWSLDSRLAVETSRLEFSGDTEQSVSLTYLKPRVQLTRKLGRHQLQARVFRDVGQLDFNDFVSSAQLVDDFIQGGNPDLRPQTNWATELEADMRFTEDMALRVRLFKHFLDDVEDTVPVGPPGNQFDAPGNIGGGHVIGTEVALRVPLKPVLPGGTLSINGTWSDSSVRDPLTGRNREIGDSVAERIEVELRQDLNAAKVAWGLTYVASTADTDYRIDEIDSFRELQRIDAFVETTAIQGFKLKLIAYNALSDTEERQRLFYAPDRRGVLASSEVGNFRPGTWWLLTLSSSF
ncbi:MAG: TonB-dependent receptor [Steroidobacteraceae bacterium]|nr:TonB-dependent receptor [Steroidobacteraceae bacterium]